MKEEYLLTGPLEPTNRPYALAKIAGIEMCSAYNRQYGTQYLAVMPTNLYGPGDNYDLRTSHVLPALIRKAHEAKLRGDEAMVVWGTGKPMREFLYSDDMAQACVFLLRLPEERFRELLKAGTFPLVNIGAGKDLSIRELAQLVCEAVGFRGRLEFDRTKPDGTPRKLMDSGKLERLGWRAQISLREGIGKTYEDFCRVR
jgi:GDP-L-fucose synthase